MKKILTAYLMFSVMTVWAATEQQKVSLAIADKGHARVVVVLGVATHESTNRLDRIEAINNAQEQLLQQMQGLPMKLIHQYQNIPSMAFDVFEVSAFKALESLQGVKQVSLDHGGKGSLDESRPWVDADYVQSLGLTGEGVSVAVLDSGYDSDHPSLADDLVGEFCSCTNCCPNGSSSQTGAGSAEDDHGHGTHVAGIISGNGNQSPLGIAPDTEIVAVKVLDSNNSFCCSSDVVAGMDWVMSNRPDVSALSMSLGTFAEFDGFCDGAQAWITSWENAVTELNNLGIATIAASMNAGNSQGMAVPACLRGSLAVGASFDNQDSVAAFSNSSSALDILAPGVSITSAQMGGGSVTFNGTSMATPHVAAALALMTELYPNASLSEKRACLVSSPVMITDNRNGITRPRLDVVDAIACIDQIFVEGFE